MEFFDIISHRDLKNSKKVRLEVVGALNEEVELDDGLLKDFDIVELDLKSLKRMNSLGIREWCRWIRTAPSAQFIFYFCPKIFIQQANTMLGLIPPQSKFMSFYVPYCNDESGEELDFLFSYGKDYHTHTPQSFNEIQIPETIKNDNGEVFAIDVNRKRYLKFLFGDLKNIED